MIVGVPREIYPGERRVALVPAVFPCLAKAGLEVVVEAGAGVSGRVSGCGICRRRARRSWRIGLRCLRTADIIVRCCAMARTTRTGTEDCAAAAARAGV